MQQYRNSKSIMETRDHSKNGASPKSQTSKENIINYKMKKSFLATIMIAIIVFSACNQKKSPQQETNYPQEETGAQLVQNGNFEDFIFSLSQCFMEGKKSEIEKIILKDDIKEMVLYDESMNPLNYLEKINGEKFADAIATFDYEVIDNDYSSFHLVYLQHVFVLDIDVMHKGKALILKSKDENVLSGVYFSYKNKWYIWKID